MKFYSLLAISAALLAAPLSAQIIPSQVQRIQGTSGGSNVGDPVSVVITDGSGNIAPTGAVQGNVAAGATDSGAPVKMGCYAMSTVPTAVTNGQRANTWCGLTGVQATALYNLAGTSAVDVSFASTDGSSYGVVGMTAKSYGYVYNGTNGNRTRDIIGSDGLGTGVQAMAPAPQSAATGSITPTAGSLVATIASKTTAGNLYSVSATTGATALYLYVFNATTQPADGAVTAGTASGNYQICSYVAATATYTTTFEIPERYSVGIRPVMSTTACGTLTASATAVFLKTRSQ